MVSAWLFSCQCEEHEALHRTLWWWSISLTKMNRTGRSGGKRAAERVTEAGQCSCVSCHFPTNQVPGSFRNHSPGWHGRQSQSIEHSNGTITIMLHRIHSQGWRTRVGGSIPRRVHFLTTCTSTVGRDVGKFLAMESKHLTPERVESCKHCGTKTQYCERSQKSPKREGGAWAWLPFSSLVEYRHSIRG